MPIELSREELYERVWIEPIQKLSKAYGLSDVGLAKICRRYNIPIPPRGYWAKKQAGHKVEKAALPPDVSVSKMKIHLPGASERVAKPAPEPPAPAHPLIAAESEPSNVITVPDDLRVRHPLLRSTREFWRMISRPSFSWDTPLPAHINIAVANETRPRALRLFQALFMALEKRGHKVSAGEHGRLHVTVLDEQCELYLRERQRQVRREIPKGAKFFESSRPYDLVHTGEFEFRIEKRFNREIVRDGKDRPVETRLNDIVAALIRAALAEKAYQAQQEPRWTAENRPLIDRSKPATTSGRPRPVSSTSSRPPDANPSVVSCASCEARI